MIHELTFVLSTLLTLTVGSAPTDSELTKRMKADMAAADPAQCIAKLKSKLDNPDSFSMRTEDQDDQRMDVLISRVDGKATAYGRVHVPVRYKDRNGVLGRYCMVCAFYKIEGRAGLIPAGVSVDRAPVGKACDPS